MTQTSSAHVPPPEPADGAATAPEHPLPTFDALPLSTELRAAIADMGYEHPTPVQLAVWEPATRGKDAVVQARTGTGKTAAFGMPIVDHIVRRSVSAVQALVLCPTRELALQVSRELERLGKNKSVQIAAIYGGAPMQRQIDQIAAGAQIVVGTPGRVLDHLRRGTLDPKDVRLLVLDESDEMLSMGFERELTAILDHLPPERQTLLFSATVPPDIERIAKNKLRSPEFVTLSGDHVGALSIQHFVYMVAGDKLGALVRVLEVENPESAVVFCNTKDETERVAQALTRQGFDADWLNGDLPQADREKVMTATRAGKLRFLVATDVAARGIDISHLTHVINFDFPQDAETYVHRTGRTGRAGKTGTAISLIAPRDIGGLYMLRLTYKIRPVERQIPTAGELKTRAEADLVTMLAEAFLAKPAHPDDLALARRLLSHDQYDAIVAGLLRDHLGARPTAQDEAAAARRATPAHAPEPRRERGEERERREARGERQGREREGRERGGREREGREREGRRERDGRRERREPAAEARNEPVRWSDAREPHGTPRAEGEKTEAPRTRREPGIEAAGERRGEERRERGKAPSLPRPAGPRHADFATWQPPEEEGDDQPILRGGERVAAVAAPQRREAAAPAREPEAEAALAEDLAEVFVNVGRRDGARAADLARVLVERGGMASEDVRRVRVRDRHAFVSVRKQDLARAVAALTGATIGEKVVNAEPAREQGKRAPEGEVAATDADEPSER